MNPPDHTSESLIEALRSVRVPADNHELIRRITASVGIDRYTAVDQVRKPYVRAKRRDGLPDLHIFYGYTNGFTSEEEVICVAGADAERGASSRKGTWYVAHPVNQVRAAFERSRSVRRAAEYCECGMQRSLTGVCGNCD